MHVQEILELQNNFSTLQLENERLELQNNLSTLELENERLKSELQSKNRLLEQMQHTLLMLPKTPRVNQVHTTDLYQRKLEYYKEHKHDVDIILKVRHQLDKLGYKTLKTLPWQMVKYNTDKKFESIYPKVEIEYGKPKQDVGSQSSSIE